MVPLKGYTFTPKRLKKIFFQKYSLAKEKKKKRRKKEADLTLPILWDEWGWRKKGFYLEVTTTAWLHGCFEIQIYTMSYILGTPMS